MNILNHTQTLQAICKAHKQWGCYLNIYIPVPYILAFEDLPKAALWFDWEEHGQLAADESGYMLFDSEEEMWRVYRQTVGDDGPTELNQYDGPVRVYMLTCDPSGQLMNENT